MKNHYISFLSTLLTLSISLQAQPTIYIKGGYSNSNWRGEGLSIFSSLGEITNSAWVNQQSMSSYYAGAMVNLPVADRFLVETGLQYGRVGASLKGNLAIRALEILGISAGARAITQRLEMPVLAKFEVAKGLSLVAGPQVNYTFDSDVQLQASVLGINLVNNKVDIDNYTEPISASAVGGIQYAFNNGWQVQATYEYGLTRIAKNNSADIYQNAIRLGIGIPVMRAQKE
jgi:hypothetical protein